MPFAYKILLLLIASVASQILNPYPETQYTDEFISNICQSYNDDALLYFSMNNYGPGEFVLDSFFYSNLQLAWGSHCCQSCPLNYNQTSYVLSLDFSHSSMLIQILNQISNIVKNVELPPCDCLPDVWFVLNVNNYDQIWNQNNTMLNNLFLSALVLGLNQIAPVALMTDPGSWMSITGGTQINGFKWLHCVELNKTDLSCDSNCDFLGTNFEMGITGPIFVNNDAFQEYFSNTECPP